MRRLALLLALALAPALHAQAPGPGPGPEAGPRGGGGRQGGPAPFARGPAFGRGMRAPGGPSDIGSFLLAHTAELKLSDQQVTRLAAIARRSGDRRQAMMRAMDSLATRRPPVDSVGRGRRAPSPAMRAETDRLRDQRRADLREALAVLTPDQLALAWELGRGF